MEKFNTYFTVELFFKTLNVYIIADYFTLNFFPKDKTKKIYQFSKNKCFNGNNPSHRHHYHYFTNQNTCSHERRHQPPTKISHAILTYIFHKDTTITCHSPRTHLPLDVARTPTIEALEGTPTILTTVKRSHYHSAILNHHNNECIVDKNNNNNNNNIENIFFCYTSTR